MGKIGISAIKYTIKAKIEATGVVERPDVIGAIFGQTEGLLGNDLELRELQKGGRIGRIEVIINSENGKSTGSIDIPTSLSKEDTALIGASLETIDRIGPCDATISVASIDDVRAGKREFLVDRAKALLDKMGETAQETQELSGQVKTSIKTGEIRAYGPDKLDGGPTVENARELILVEGRADVVTLLKCGIPNVLSVGGTKAPISLRELCKGKTIIAYLDGDRGGDLILKTLQQLVTVTYVARAPQGMEVEELTQKDAIKALRSRVPVAQAVQMSRPRLQAVPQRGGRDSRRGGRGHDRREAPRTTYRPEFAELDKIAMGLNGTGKAALVRKDGAGFKEVGRAPSTELANIMKNLQEGQASAIVIDGFVDQNLVMDAARKKVGIVVGLRGTRGVKPPQGVLVVSGNDLKPPAGMAVPAVQKVEPVPAVVKKIEPAQTVVKKVEPAPVAVKPAAPAKKVEPVVKKEASAKKETTKKSATKTTKKSEAKK